MRFNSLRNLALTLERSAKISPPPRTLPSLSNLLCRYYSPHPRSAAPAVASPPPSPPPNRSKHQKKDEKKVRLSKLISSYSKNLVVSRNEAERLIRTGSVTYAGEMITQPGWLLHPNEIQDATIQVDGKPLLLRASTTTENGDNGSGRIKTRVWMVKKLAGELVTENDPHGRPSLMDRLVRMGVGKTRGKRRMHLKPVGRLDMSTEGLILVTNDGEWARQMEMPNNKLHRVYRVKVHGLITPNKLTRLRHGMVIAGVHYQGMRVELEENRRRRMSGSTNTWIRLTCVEGKNRMIRKVLDHLGLTAARLIRVSYGDYEISPNFAANAPLEVQVKPAKEHKRRGSVAVRKPKRRAVTVENRPILWVKYR